MEHGAAYTSRHSPPVRAARGSDGSCQPAARHSSRAEIDMAIGAYMALWQCTEYEARTALIQAARGARVGLGAASHALLEIATRSDLSGGNEAALQYWRAHLAPMPTVATDT